MLAARRGGHLASGIFYIFRTQVVHYFDSSELMLSVVGTPLASLLTI